MKVLLVYSLGLIHIIGTKSNRILGYCSLRLPLKKQKTKHKANVIKRALGKYN